MAKASVTETKRVRYEDDLYAWTQAQAALLRARRPDGLDWVNLAEEIAAVGGSDRRKLESRLCIVLLHLLKWQAQPGLRGASWRKTLRTQRREIRKLLRQSPSLRRDVPGLIRDAYPDAAKDAIDETGLPSEHFPGVCPYTPDVVLDEDHLPDERARHRMDSAGIDVQLPIGRRSSANSR